MMSSSALERPWKVQFLLCGWTFPPCRAAQPHRGSNQLPQWQWPFPSSGWHFTETLTQQCSVCSTWAAYSVGEKYSYTHYCMHLLCAHHPPPNKRNKCTSYRDLFWVWKEQSLAAPSSSAWCVEVKDEPDLILPALPHHPPCFSSTSSRLPEEQWRSQICPSCPSQHSGAPWFSTALVPGSTEVAQAVAGGGEQPSCHLAAGGTPQVPRHTGGLGSYVLAFPNEKKQPPGLKALIPLAKSPGSSSKCSGGSGSAWWRWDAQTQLPWWPGSASWGGICAVGWHRTAGSSGSSLLENGLSVSCFLHSACLSVCLSQAVNPLTHKRSLPGAVAAWQLLHASCSSILW